MGDVSGIGVYPSGLTDCATKSWKLVAAGLGRGVSFSAGQEGRSAAMGRNTRYHSNSAR